MQSQKIQQKQSKKIYTNITPTSAQSRPKTINQALITNKPTRIRRTDHTDEKYSQVSNSRLRQQNQMNNGYGYQQVDEDGDQNNVSQSRFTKNGKVNGLQFLSEKQENIIELKQRLKNIHHFYRIRIQQQRTKNIQRNQIFISVIQQLQRHHNDKVITLQKSLEQLQSDKQQITLVDQRMGSIKTTIEDILKQSQQLKQSNQKHQKQILQKQLENKQKQNTCIALKQDLDSMREILEQFQRLKLKQNRRNKQMLEMIQKIEKGI